MRKVLLTATALLGSVIFLVPGAEAFDWNGQYVGGVVGAVRSTGSLDIEYSDPQEAPDSFDFDGIGVLGGVTLGYNFVLDNNVVVGIEADASLANLNSSIEQDNLPFYDVDVEEQLHSLLTARGRAGILSEDGQTLAFVTGGLAGGWASASAAIDEFAGIDDPITAEASGFVVGVIGGIGVEHAIKDDLTVKAELLAYQLGALEGIGDAGKGEFDATYNPSGIIFRTGVNFHF